MPALTDVVPCVGVVSKHGRHVSSENNGVERLEAESGRVVRKHQLIDMFSCSSGRA
jgi:hypothetical protein